MATFGAVEVLGETNTPSKFNIWNCFVQDCFSARFTEGQHWHVSFQRQDSQPLQQHQTLLLIGCTEGRSSQQFLNGLIIFYDTRQVCRGAGKAAGCLGVVTRWHQQVCEHEQLVLGEALPMLLPVIVVSAPELRQGLLHRHLREKKTEWSRHHGKIHVIVNKWQTYIYAQLAQALQDTKYWYKPDPEWSTHTFLNNKSCGGM